MDREAYSQEIKNADGKLFNARMASNLEGVYGDTKLMQVLPGVERVFDLSVGPAKRMKNGER